jgi:hypothetical protein
MAETCRRKQRPPGITGGPACTQSAAELTKQWKLTPSFAPADVGVSFCAATHETGRAFRAVPEFETYSPY